MRRRTLLKGVLAAAVGASGFRLPLVDAADYRGKLFVFVQADGGWDPTSFCDPKSNTSTNLSSTTGPNPMMSAGPVTSLRALRQQRSVLREVLPAHVVINGVDAQTNSHTVGIRAQLERRNSEAIRR